MIYLQVKTIRINKKGVIEQHFRLTDVKLKAMAYEEWEQSEFYNFITTTSFLLVVFKEQDDGSFILIGSQLWHVPYKDLELIGKGWCAVRDKIRDGITFTPTITESGSVVMMNDLPKITDNPIYHIRPHRPHSYYKLGEGNIFGSGSEADGDELPDGRIMTGQSNWFRRDYMLNQLREDLKK